MGSPAPVALLAGSFGVRFPGLGFCQWSGRPCACCPGSLRAVRGFCLVDGSLSAGFCLGLQVSSPSFHSPRPRSLSRPFLLQPLAPGAIPGWRLCLSWLPSSLGLSLAISWWHTCWYPFVSVRLSSGRSFPPSWWGPALLLSLGALPVRSGLSGALVDLPGSLLFLLPGYRS